MRYSMVENVGSIPRILFERINHLIDWVNRWLISNSALVRSHWNENGCDLRVDHQSITFENSQWIVSKENHSIDWWDIGIIRKYQFLLFQLTYLDEFDGNWKWRMKYPRLSSVGNGSQCDDRDAIEPEDRWMTKQLDRN